MHWCVPNNRSAISFERRPLRFRAAPSSRVVKRTQHSHSPSEPFGLGGLVRVSMAPGTRSNDWGTQMSHRHARLLLNDKLKASCRTSVRSASGGPRRSLSPSSKQSSRSGYVVGFVLENAGEPERRTQSTLRLRGELFVLYICTLATMHARTPGRSSPGPPPSYRPQVFLNLSGVCHTAHPIAKVAGRAAGLQLGVLVPAGKSDGKVCAVLQRGEPLTSIAPVKKQQ